MQKDCFNASGDGGEGGQDVVVCWVVLGFFYVGGFFCLGWFF